jgi:hypothetical protein
MGDFVGNGPADSHLLGNAPGQGVCQEPPKKLLATLLGTAHGIGPARR